MTKKQKEIKLRPEVLKALRETSGYSVEEVAKKLKTSVDKAREVEEGKAAFTLNQIKKLAEIYKRPIAAFFSSSIPELPKSTDYRINRENRLTPDVYLAQRRAFFLIEKIKELSGKRSQIPAFSDELKAEDLAREFSKTLNVELMKRRKSDEILTFYKKVLEEKLSIIIIEYPLKADDVRAFSIYSDLSAIVLNETDKPAIKLFSLFHEICHLIRKTGGICSLDIERHDNKEEYYCNNFAAEFLVPIKDLYFEARRYFPISWEEFNELADIYGVSKQVIMLRLLMLGYIDKKFYEEYKKEMGEKGKSKIYGRRNWDKIFLNRIGNIPLQEIKKAYDKQIITFHEATSILGLKAKYAEKFIAQ